MKGFTNFLEETEIAIKDSVHNTDDNSCRFVTYYRIKDKE